MSASGLRIDAISLYGVADEARAVRAEYDDQHRDQQFWRE